MNNVNLIGRLTRDPEVRYNDSQLCIARFSIAIDRGNDKGADFPSIIVFGKQAENCEKYLSKGRLVGISGHLQTGSYTNKEGNKVYTTDVIANRVEFLGRGNSNSNSDDANDQIDGFENIADEDVPF